MLVFTWVEGKLSKWISSLVWCPVQHSRVQEAQNTDTSIHYSCPSVLACCDMSIQLSNQEPRTPSLIRVGRYDNRCNEMTRGLSAI